MSGTCTFFAFPLNLLLASMWMIGWIWLYRNRRECSLIRYMLSPIATLSSVVLLLAACLLIGFSGNREFVQSLVFVVLLLYLQTVLFLVILRGWRRPDGVRWRFLLIHAGFLLAVGAGFCGAPDSSEARVKMGRGETVREASSLDGGRVVLPYELSLEDYCVEVSDNGKPVHYEAFINIDGQEPVSVTVNHPYRVRFGEDIYLTSVSDSGCVLQIVREPWRYFALAGILMLLAGAFMLFIKGPQR